MQAVSAPTSKRAARLLETVGAAGDDPRRFARLGVTELPRVLASELTTLSVCDLRNGRRRVVGNPDHALSADDISAFDRHFFEHPLVRFHTSHHDGGTHRISDSLTQREFRGGSLYNDYYRRIGIDHAMAIPLYVDDATLVSFVLNRARRDFSDDEVEVADQLGSWLAAMYRNAVALRRAAEAVAQLREIAEGDDWAIVRVDSRRRVREMSASARKMLAGALVGRRPRIGAPLPDPIERWLDRAAESDAPSLALAPLVLAGPRGALTVRALPEIAGDAAWLLLVRAVPAPVAATAAAALTLREREILRWVAAGKSDRQIASIVGASPRTVQKHLEHIYVKLGVENRTAAAMRAREAAHDS